MRVALAKYSVRKAVWRIILMFGLALVGLAVGLYAGPSPTYGYRLHVMMVIAGLVSLAFVALILWQLGFDDKNAIWFEGDKIVYLNGWYQSVDVRDVVSISADIRGWFDNTYVVLNLRNARRKSIPADWLSEPAQDLAARLGGKIADLA